MNSISANFDILSDDLKDKVIFDMSVIDLARAGAVCRSWRVLFKNSKYWIPFFKLIEGSSENFQDYRKAVIEEVVSLKKIVAEDTKARAVSPHIYLSRLGLSSLQAAHSCIKNITREKETYNRFEKEGAYYKLGFEYLKNNLFKELEGLIVEMSSESTIRGILAYNLEQKYLASNDFQRALSIMQNIKAEQLEGGKSLSLFIQAAEKANEVECVFQALECYKNLSYWGACVRDFAEFLDKKNDLANYEKLTSLYPDICKKKPNLFDIMYNLVANQPDRAEQIALTFEDPMEKTMALFEIKDFYNRSGNQKEANRVASLIANLKHVE